MTLNPDIDWNRVIWSGSRYIDVQAPKPEDMLLEEIAVGLARENRYGGNATSVPWSVLQHSLLCHEYARDDGIDQGQVLLTLLLHDAPEYILRDILSPVKRHLPDYKRLESIWWKAVATRFNLPLRLPYVIKRYDVLAASSEKAALISAAAGPWPGLCEPRNLPDWILNLSEVRQVETFQAEVRRLLAQN
ncbi:hypothetical protein [Shimia sp.]|uniref:hypothetical protein n=1 Tax=Shimia sp. TaxID=1954381 RepID=UPI0032980835